MIYDCDSKENTINVKTYSYTAPGVTPTNLLSNKAYTYSTTYRDRLTSYNGNGISYNTYGYVSSYNGYNYSPEWHRFISPDDTSYLDSENVNGFNLYAY